MTRDVAEEILASGVLSHERCVDQAQQGWVRNRDCDYVMSTGAMLDDFVISWAVDAAGFPILQHPEIASFWRNAEPNAKLTYAITHPHKELSA